MTLDRLDENGVVGAGGGGFPTALKLSAPAGTFIVNAAECEPLLHKDKELLRRQAPSFFKGLEEGMRRVGARDGVIAVKEKYRDVMASLEPQLPPRVRLFPLTDTYPAGDELLLVHDVTGRVIPPGGLPKNVDAVVANVETLVNVGLDRPVTHKYLTVAGAVAAPVTLRVPVGTAIEDVIAAAGGMTEPDARVLVGGVMMGRLARDLREAVTKTTGGLVVLPKDHLLVRRYAADLKSVTRIGRSACDQCRFCTELCPRFLLGHPIEPHRAMQSLGFTGSADPLIAGTLYCCECNLCSLYSCPEDLDPKTVCVQAKSAARERGLTFKGRREDVEPHPLAASRRVPMRRLIARLGLEGFRNVGPLEDRPLAPRRVALPLKQHAGAAATPRVSVGDRVRAGDLIAAPKEGALGARIHASIDGVVRAVNGVVVIEV
jgi:Na+-translocating ferredoxin:NAD+ oxidoreductase RnfC subunit